CRRVGRGLGLWGAWLPERMGGWVGVAGDVAIARLRCGCGSGLGAAACTRGPSLSRRAALGGGRRGGGDANSALRASDMRRLDSPATPSTSALVKLAPASPRPQPCAGESAVLAAIATCVA